ncbi:DEAD/DEAH box helicase [Aquipseudomonas alcaligenes]|uniref:hypothetical protein n=1 Tax=Aquipseudomonas alcaligenes TaxID=43263 RepID=UPI00364BB203
MIFVHVHDERTDEAQAAHRLARMAADFDSEIDSSPDVVLEIFASAQCFGQRTKDIDLLVFFADYRNEKKLFLTKDRKSVHSICVAIELKGHPPEKVVFDGAHCSVYYRDQLHDVTGQSESQKISLKKYIENHPKTPKAPWIVNLIWLTRVPKNILPQSTSNIIGAESTWQDFLEKAALLSGSFNPNSIQTFSNRSWLNKITSIFSRKIHASKIDRKRLEAITKNVIDRQQYADKLGQQLLIYRGRGGTGKTVRLIQTAYHAYSELGMRVLILTYNKALVADINRLLTLLGAKDSIGDRSLSIRSIYSFMYEWLLCLDVIQKGQPDFLSNYEKYKSEAVALLKGGAISDGDLDSAFVKNSKGLQWDMLLIDESQDWPSSERDLIYHLYGHKKVIIADGVDQFVRGVERIDWRDSIPSNETQIVPLRKSLRLKSSLCQVVTHFAELIDYSSWKLEPIPEAHGGKVIVLTGSPFSREFYTKIAATAKSDGNKPIDILICVPPSWVISHDDGRSSIAAQKFVEWGFECWDAVDPENREAFPTSLEQFRIVQYDSCRGLEGWVVVCFALDEFFEHKFDHAEISDAVKSDIFFNEEESALDYAKKWLMIPLTRAIDTLVIHIANEESFVGRSLKDLQARFPEDVTWMNFSPDSVT